MEDLQTSDGNGDGIAQPATEIPAIPVDTVARPGGSDMDSVASVLDRVRRLRAELPRSRNRNFDELSRPEERRAARLARWLAGVERDLLAGASVRVEPTDSGFRVSIEFPALRARRETYLTTAERALVDTALRTATAQP